MMVGKMVMMMGADSAAITTGVAAAATTTTSSAIGEPRLEGLVGFEAFRHGQIG